MSGKVYIVGAGPGAADLLTLRAATVLRAARVVLHDDLVPQEILDLCPASAQVVNVGKRCGNRGRSQEQINALMVWHAREMQAQTIVRLKSGDPAVFGRLGEELDALRRAGVEFEIVPGVTAAAAAAASAKITLTDRRAASALVVVTAHNCRNESLSRTMFEPARSTYAIYMPGPDYSSTVKGLVESGQELATPCAVVSNAGRANEEVRYLTLQELASVKGISAPAMLIVGEVAREHLPGKQGDFLSKVSSEARDPYNQDQSPLYLSLG
ncbi:MAG TPA: uroporphyrinogen-III C-methyltransferase [Candidatus Limnocylindrales bacterium]|nr:uroporphyrinogen-III C-methyltransferase [Candidatus Limnocylindrales bacterium]